MYFTKKEIADAFGVTILTVDNWAQGGRIAKRQSYGGRVVFTPESVLEEAKRQQTELINKMHRLDKAVLLFTPNERESVSDDDLLL